jgi:hypothetical protein
MGRAESHERNLDAIDERGKRLESGWKIAYNGGP